MLIMFPMESDSTYNKYAYVESSEMDAFFRDNDIESVHFRPATTGKVTPLYLAKRNSYFLPRFAWYEEMRPVSPDDVFVVPESQRALMRSEIPAPEAAEASKRRKEIRKVRRSADPKGGSSGQAERESPISAQSENISVEASDTIPAVTIAAPIDSIKAH